MKPLRKNMADVELRYRHQSTLAKDLVSKEYDSSPLHASPSVKNTSCSPKQKDDGMVNLKESL